MRLVRLSRKLESLSLKGIVNEGSFQEEVLVSERHVLSHFTKHLLLGRSEVASRGKASLEISGFKH